MAAVCKGGERGGYGPRAPPREQLARKARSRKTCRMFCAVLTSARVLLPARRRVLFLWSGVCAVSYYLVLSRP